MSYTTITVCVTALSNAENNDYSFNNSEENGTLLILRLER